ncbi:MAG: hypothetical protein ACOYLE_06815 [Bacteroidales bacterium]
MNKYFIAIIALVFVLSACSKEESIKSQATKNSSIAVNSKKLTRGEGFGDISKDEVIRAIQSFQLNRKNYWESGNSPNYTQAEALFQMPLVLNFELPGYGYFSGLESRNIEISIANVSGSSKDDAILDGKDMFVKYREIENYIKTQLGDQKLYAADFNVTETNASRTVFSIRILAGAFTKSIGGQHYSSEFPAIPINTIPSGDTYGTGQYLANWFTAVFNSVPYDGTYTYRVSGQILVNLYPPIEACHIAPDPNYQSTWFVYHSSTGAAAYSSDYKIPYYNWINNRRLAAPSYAFTTYIDFYYTVYVGTPPANWVDFTHNHSIDLNFAKWEYTPEMFINHLPIIN